jgi:hypothetical protein
MAPDAAAALLRRWLYGATPSALLFVLMFFGHVFDEIELLAFGWLLLTLFSFPTLLFVAISRQAVADRLVAPAAVRSLLTAVTYYLGVVLLALVSMQYWLQGENAPGVDGYLWRTAAFFWPWNALLMWVAAMLFLQRHAAFRRSQSETLAHFIEQKAGLAGSQDQPGRQRAFQLLAKSDLPAVFKLLEAVLDGTEKRHDLLVVQSAYQRVTEAQRFQTEDPASVHRQINRMVLTLAEMIERHL